MTRTVRTASIPAVAFLGSPFFLAFAGGTLLTALGWAAIQLLT